jgi:lysozyme family protein
MSEASDKAFQKVIEKTLGHEGGYVNHPDDRGGPTNWGITQRVARENGYTGDMRNLSIQDAVRIYKAKYWAAPQFDRLAEISTLIAALLFDIGVNAGPTVGGRFLQRALNVLNRKGTDFADLKVDGAVGPATRTALSRYRAIRGREGEVVLLGMIRAQLSVFYIEIAERNPNNESFVYGWQLNRVLGNA